MPANNLRAWVWIVGLALFAVAVWFLGITFTGQPAPLGFDAPSTAFSAARADQILGRLLGPEVPHPVSSAANHAVRDRVRAEFAALGVKTQLYRALGCNGRPKYGFFACGTTEDIIADVAPGEGKAIVLMAHYDSVPAGPGASDDQSGVATVLETVRALKARGMKTIHPILALITDGEEAGLLGAASFLNNPALKARVGAVINVEARGNQGPSLLFQTSPGDGPLIELYARNVRERATSSLFEVIYKALPNDTDLTLFIDQGFTSFNFAFSGNVAHYHTPLDLRRNLSPSTLQQHGDNMLGVASGLMQTDFAALKGGNDIYLTLFGRALPRVPASWALPLSLATLVLLLLALFVSRQDEAGVARWLAAVAIPPAALIGSAAFGWILFEIAVLVSGQTDPTYAYPLSMRIALALGVATIVILVSRLAGARMAALSVWLWLSLLAVVSAALLPGLSPYFLFPAVIGSVVLLAQARLAGAWNGVLGSSAIFAAALLPLVIFLSLAAAGESVQGLQLHPLFTVPAALGVLGLVPLLAARPLSRGAWLGTSVVFALAAMVIAGVAGLQPAYSSVSPQRLDIDFVDDHIANKSMWLIDGAPPLSKRFRDVMAFSDKPERALPITFNKSYVAAAGATRFTAPSATATSIAAGAGRRVTLRLHGSDQANRMFVIIGKDSALNKIAIEGQTFVPVPDSLNKFGTIFGCMTDDCRSQSVTLTFANQKPVTLWIGEQRYGLPPDGAKLRKARQPAAVASHSGDTTVVFGEQKLP